MTYSLLLNLINNLITKVNPDLINFSKKETRNNVPTQVSSNFLTNKAILVFGKFSFHILADFYFSVWRIFISYFSEKKAL